MNKRQWLFVVQNLDTTWRYLIKKIIWSGETFSDKSKPSESLHCWHRCGAHEHAGLCRRASPLRAGMDASVPGQSTAGVPSVEEGEAGGVRKRTVTVIFNLIPRLAAFKQGGGLQ